jgi:bifunctional non-homologous end joining protein LigD
MTRDVALARLDKPLWPQIGFTKGHLIDYYRAVAPVLLPHITGHPLTLARFPDGIDGPGFYQQECRGAPDWLRVAPMVARNGKLFRTCVVDDLAGLLWVANLATVELHPFLATADDPERAAQLVLDLDPGPPAGLVACCGVALELRAVLAARGLAAWAKTSGGGGLHLYVPVGGGVTFARTRALARALAAELTGRHPDRTVDTMRLADRRGKVLIDWRQNEARRSMVAVYSLRAREEPLVSTPVTWEEVEVAWTRQDARALRFRPAEVLRRIEARGDLFRPVLEAGAASSVRLDAP